MLIKHDLLQALHAKWLEGNGIFFKVPLSQNNLIFIRNTTTTIANFDKTNGCSTSTLLRSLFWCFFVLLKMKIKENFIVFASCQVA